MRRKISVNQSPESDLKKVVCERAPSAGDVPSERIQSLVWETKLGRRLREELFAAGFILVVTHDGVFIVDSENPLGDGLPF